MSDEVPSQDEQSFLAEYRKKVYPRPSVTVDLVMFSMVDTDLKVLLIRRGAPPWKGTWALPGGFVDVGDAFENQGEDLADAAARELAEETGLAKEILANNRVHLEQLYTFGRAYRDPRTRVISVAYVALVPPQLVPLVRAGSDAAAVRWFSMREEISHFVRPGENADGDALAFDHHEILDMAVARVRGKIDYTSIACALVPPTFTFAELREVYEAVKGDTFDSSNFRRKFDRMVVDGIIEQAPGKRTPGTLGGRPAFVYRFRP